MRNVQISTAVFAAIWSRREEGEESEDAILSRLLGCQAVGEDASTPQLSQSSEGGVRDVRNGVAFPEGFKIFRRYKTREYVAEARSGHWLRLDNMTPYATLNQLNASIVAGMENVWNGNWKFRTPSGEVRSIDTLRKS